MKLGLIGYGKMGSAIIGGAIASGTVKKEDVYIAVRREEMRLKLVSDGFCVVSPMEMQQLCDLIVLAVKPQDFMSALEQTNPDGGKTSMFMSIAAGIPISTVKHYYRYPVHVARLMPNTAATLGESASSICFCSDCGQDSRSAFNTIAAAIGSVTEISEEQMHDVLALSGSYIAYAYYFMNAFYKRALELGFDGETALSLVANATKGAADMALKSGKPLDTLISDVCSKGGTTIEGIKVFNQHQLDEIVREAYDKCAARSRELAQSSK